MDKGNFDKLTKEALSEEDSQFMNGLDEQNVFEMLMGLYKGKNRWLSLYIMIIIFVAFGFMIYFSIRFFEVEAIRDMMINGALAFFCLIIVTMLKFWFWMQMNNNAILRELKRIELQMSIIAMNLNKK